MAKKTPAAAARPDRPSLADAVRANLQTRHPGFLPWHKRLADEHRENVEEFRRAWLAGEFGWQLEPVARAVAAYLHEHGISTIGHQGVIRWLKQKD